MLPVLFLSVFVNFASTAPAEFYQSRYDHVDIDSVLNTRRLVNHYAACLLSQGVCPPQGVDLKRVLPEAIATNCAKCTEKQKTGALRVIKRLRKEYPKIWSQLTAVWDPDDIYVRRFESTFDNDNSIDGSTPGIFDRFGGDDEPSSTTASSTSTSTTTTKPITSIVTNPTTKPITSIITKPTTKPTTALFTNKPIIHSITRPPPYTTIGANLQATVTFLAALKNAIIQLHQLKLDIINKLFGRYGYYHHYH